MGGEIDRGGTRQAGLDAFLEERVAEGFAVETRTETHAIIFRRPERLAAVPKCRRSGAFCGRGQ